MSRDASREDLDGADPPAEASAQPSTERTPRTSARTVAVARWVGVLAVLIWLGVTGSWLLGKEVLLQRDVLLANVPYKAYGAQELAAGRIPAINTAWGLGQPFRGNPGTLPFYPGNVLYLILPFWSAFGAHYALHWLLAGVAMAILARRLGASKPASVLAGLTYSGGVVVAAVSFYNTLAVLAWWPLVLAGIAGRATVPVGSSLREQTTADPRSLVLGCMACGMSILAGEPVALVLLSPTAVLLAWHRGEPGGPREGTKRQGRERGDEGRGLPAACLRTGITYVVGAFVAAPQVVATFRILPFTSRGGPGEQTDTSLGFSLAPSRLLEFLMPYPEGIPFRDDSWGYWASEMAPQIPYFYELFAGILTVPLVLFGLRRRPRWAFAVAAGILVAWLGKDFHWLSALSTGMFRHPEKFLLLAVPFIPLLAAAGFDRLQREPETGRTFLLLASLLPFLALAGIALRFDAFVTWHQGRLIEGSPQGAAYAMALLWVASLFALWVGLLLSARFVGRRQTEWLLAIQLASLVSLVALFPTDDTRYYGEQPFRRSLGERTALWSPLHGNLTHLTHPAPRYVDPGIREGSRWIAHDLDPSVGIPSGLRYPIVVDLDGLASPLLRPIAKRIAAMPEPEQLNWLRVMGVEALVVDRDRKLDLPILAEQPSPDGAVLLQEVVAPMPRALWPTDFETVGSVGDAYRHVSGSPDPVARPAVLLTGEAAAREQGTLHSLRIDDWRPDRIVLEVESTGGVVVLGRAFQALYRIRATGASDHDGVELQPRLANAFLLAVAVPPGRQRIEITVSSAPQWIAFALSFATLGSCLFLLVRKRL